jgi:hypothetical protein
MAGICGLFGKAFFVIGAPFGHVRQDGYEGAAVGCKRVLQMIV